MGPDPDLTLHHFFTRDHGPDIGQVARKPVLVLAEPKDHSVVPGAADQMSVEQPAATAEPRLLDQAGYCLKISP